MAHGSAATVLAAAMHVLAMAGADHVTGWTFDEGSGSIAWDDAGDTFGVLHGPVWTEGISGAAIQFDGLDDFVEITDGNGLPESLTTLDAGTIAMWFRFDTTPEAGVIHSMLYCGRESSDSDRSSFQVEVGHSQVNSKLYWTITEPADDQPTLCYDSSINLTEGVWYHYVLVVDEAGNTGYLNGEEMTGRHYNFGSPDDRRFFADLPIQSMFHLGHGLFGGDQFLHGALDEIRIWDRPLAGSEVQAYFDSFDYDPPDPPDQDGVTIVSPEDGDVVSGEVVIAGTSVGLEGGHIRVRIGDNEPVEVDGVETWSYGWDTTTTPDGPAMIRVVGRACQNCPSYSHEISVEIDNVPPVIGFSSVADGEVRWGNVAVAGWTDADGAVTLSVNGGPPEPVEGANPWTLDVDMTSLGQGAHRLTAFLSDGGDVIEQADVTVIASPVSPPVPSCDELELGDRLPWPNPAAPSWTNTCGNLCWLTVTFDIIGHSESIGLAAHLEEVFAAGPADFREFVFHDHALSGEEAADWATPGSAGYQAIQSILAEADGPDAPPHIALILVSNNVTAPIGSPGDAHHDAFVSDVRAVVDLLDDSGSGVIMSYVSAHRMKPSNLMAAWYENLAIEDVMSQAGVDEFPRIKPGPDLHSPSWCSFPQGYASDHAHPDDDGLRMMAEAWHAILIDDMRHPGDVNGDGAVSTTDLLAILAAWGACEGCIEDFTGDGIVGADDILLLLSYWT